MSVVALGDPYFVTALRTAGVDGRIVTSTKEAEEVLDALVAEQKCKVIIITNRLAILLERKRDDLNRNGYYYPVFAIVPNMDSSVGEGKTQRLYELISQAVGARLKLGGD